MSSCAVASCRNSSVTAADKSASFFPFPEDPSEQQVWLKACRRADGVHIETAVVCSAHFKKEEVVGIPCKRRLVLGAVPTLNLPPLSVVKESLTPSSHFKDERHGQRSIRKGTDEAVRLSSSINKSAKLNIASSSKVPQRTQESKSEDTRSKGISKLETYNQNEVNTSGLLNRLRVMESKYATLEKKYTKLAINHKQTLQSMGNLQRRLTNATNAKTKLQAKLTDAVYTVKAQRSLIQEKAQELLQEVFSPAQIRCIMSKQKQARWQKWDVLRALELRSFGKETYEFVKKVLQVPLPTINTLQRWTVDNPDFSYTPSVDYSKSGSEDELVE